MSLPPYGASQPTLQTWQLSYNGVTWGGTVAGAPYQMTAYTGIFDQPPVSGGDVQRDLDQGEFAGLDVLPGRDMTMAIIVQAGGALTFDEARQQIGGAMAVAGSTEQPLFIQLPSGLYACMARPRKYSGPVDLHSVQAGAALISVAMHATDPRWYAQPTQQTSIAPGGTAPITNAGQFEMRPVLVVSGPCTNPAVANDALNGTPTVTIDCTVNAGDTLTVDMLARTAVYLASGSSTPVSYWSQRTVTSTPWNLPPGASTVAFSAATYSTGCACLVQYAAAYTAI